MKASILKIMKTVSVFIFVIGMMSFIGTDAENGKTAAVVNAALDYGNGKAYLFNGVRYVKYDKRTSSVDAGFPKVTEVGWGRVAKGPIYAAVYDESNPNWKKAYLFGENRKFWRYDVKTKKFDAGYPKLIYNEWKGLPRTSTQDIDAVFSYQNGWMYFFYDNYCYLYNRKKNRVEGGRRSISTEFRGVPNDIDAAVYFKSNNKIYFFKAANYYRVDGSTKRVDAGYPKNIVKYWKGLEALQIKDPNYQPPTPTTPPVVTGGNIDDIPTDVTFTKETEGLKLKPTKIHVELKAIKVVKAPEIRDEANKIIERYRNMAFPILSSDVKFNGKRQYFQLGKTFERNTTLPRKIGKEIPIEKAKISYTLPQNANDLGIEINANLFLQGVRQESVTANFELVKFKKRQFYIPIKSLRPSGVNYKKFLMTSEDGKASVYLTYHITMTPY